MYVPPPFAEADELCSEILDFLLDCGGIYQEKSAYLTTEVLISIANGQYVIERDEAGNITLYMCYWKITPDEVEQVADKTWPGSRSIGNVIYVVECGNKTGRNGLLRAATTIRRNNPTLQGCFWHNNSEVKQFTKQKGV